MVSETGIDPIVLDERCKSHDCKAHPPADKSEESHKVMTATYRFAKSMRFNLSAKTAIASLLLIDTSDPIAVFVPPINATEQIVSDINLAASEATYTSHIWPSETALPKRLG